MVIHYNFSKRGKSHFAEDKPCQDSNSVNVTAAGLTIAAVADGVGSAENSEFGSRIAADTAVGHLSSVLSGISPERVVIAELKRAFELAFAEVCKRANNDGNPLSSYDTTLSVAVYDGDTCVYGHSGDGAIIGLSDNGDYIEITTPQKGEDAVSVIPLRAGASYWEFGVYEKPLASVILVTDGMRDLLCPSLLSRAENNVYVPAAAFFADPYLWSKARQRKKLEAIVEGFTEADGSFGTDDFLERLEEIYNHRIPDLKGEELQDFKEKCIAPDLMVRIDDDKTVVGLINTSKEQVSKEISYYTEPDWMEYKRLRDKVIYGDESEETPLKPSQGKGEGTAGDEQEKPASQDEPDSRKGGEGVKIPDEVIVEKTTDKKGRNKFIIPLIAAGAAAAAIAIGVGVATSKPPIVDDHTNASGSTEESTEDDSYGDNDNVNDDTENKTTEGTTVSTTTQTETQFTGEQKPETTTEKEDRITEESQETETNNTNSSSNSNDEIDRDTTDTNENVYEKFLKKKAIDYKTDIYYVEYDCDNDGEKEIIWEKKDGNELLIYNISTGENSTFKINLKKSDFDKIKKTFSYTEDTIQ